MDTVKTIATQRNWHDLLMRPLPMFQPAHFSALLATPVHYDHRLVHTAGKAFYGPRKITLHPAFLADQSEDMQRQHKETFFHEAAHILAVLVYGQAAGGHGFHWGHCMLCWGYEPTRYHTIGRELRQAKANNTLSLDDLD